MPGVAALKLGDDRGAGGEPAGEDVHGRVGEREGLPVDVGVRLVAVQVQRAEVEVRQFRHAAAGVGDERGDGGGAQLGHRVGVDRPLNGQVVQQRLGVARRQLEAAGRRLPVEPGRVADELREGVDRVDPHPHRVRVRGRLRPAAGAAGPRLARRRVGQPRRAPARRPSGPPRSTADRSAVLPLGAVPSPSAAAACWAWRRYSPRYVLRIRRVSRTGRGRRGAGERRRWRHAPECWHLELACRRRYSPPQITARKKPANPGVSPPRRWSLLLTLIWPSRLLAVISAAGPRGMRAFGTSRCSLG